MSLSQQWRVRYDGRPMATPPRRTMRWSLTIDQRMEGDVLVIAAAGRVGVATAPRLAETIDAAIRQGHYRVALELRGVDYISSPGLLVLQAVAARLGEHAGDLQLREVSEPVRVALHLAGIVQPGVSERR